MHRLAVFALLTLGPVWAQISGPVNAVRVRTFDAEGRALRSGYGFFLDRGGHVVTPRSLLLGASRAEIEAYNGESYAVENVVAEDPAADVLKLRATVPASAAPEVLAFHALPDPKSAVRLHQDFLDAESGRTILKVHDVPGSGEILELTGEVREEQAGAPVLDEYSGVVAMLAPRWVSPRSVGFAVPIERLMTMPSRSYATVAEWSAGVKIEAEEAYRLALGSLWSGNYQGAAGHLKRALAADPNHAEAWFHLGFASGKLGKSADKIEAYERAIAVRPGYAEAHYTLGLSFMMLGERSRAIREYEALKTIHASYAEKLLLMIHALHVDKDGKHEDDPEPL
ncbi:MAG: tetratricopeptide repeat protein [Bryobacteraceae bacterium]